MRVRKIRIRQKKRNMLKRPESERESERERQRERKRETVVERDCERRKIVKNRSTILSSISPG